MKYEKVKVARQKIDRCSICLKKSTLTWDHIPPKGGIELKSVDQETVFQRMTVKNSEKKFKSISQNGVKYRTLCSDCNNNWLGAKFDPILNDFSLGIGKILETTIEIPNKFSFETRPTALMRAVLGHLLASKATIDEVVFDKDIRDCFFDKNMPIPETINMFYWIYPYQNITIMRDFVLPAVRGNFDSLGIFSILKYYPIAYMICNLKKYEDLNEMTQFRSLSTDDTALVPIDLSKIRHALWPEAAEQGNFMVGGAALESSVHATPRVKQK